MLVDGLRLLTHFTSSGGAEVVVILSNQHRHVLAAEGYSKNAIRSYIMERAWRTAAEIRASGSQLLFRVDSASDEARVYAFKKEDSIHIIAAGDITNRFSAFLPALRSTLELLEPVSRLVRAS